jgi:hypothetical protein
MAALEDGAQQAAGGRLGGGFLGADQGSAEQAAGGEPATAQ